MSSPTELVSGVGTKVVPLRQALARLATHEDPNHLHKTLGILSLVSFVYRYAYCTLVYGNLGFTGSVLDWVTVGLHMALSTSSLIFHVLKRRMLSRPMIIWEEYRLHAVVFSLRCATVFVFGQLRPWAGTYWEQAALTTMVLAHHLVVDEITRRHGSREHTTVRVHGRSSYYSSLLLRFYSFYQFAALASHLTPSPHLSALGYNTFIAIQSSAFLMTLFRKGIIGWQMHGIVYTLCLLLSMFHIFSSHSSPIFVMLIVISFLLRTQLGVNKYLVWCLFAFATVAPITNFSMFTSAWCIVLEKTHSYYLGGTPSTPPTSTETNDKEQEQE